MIEFKPFRYYTSVYHDPVFDDFPLLANLTIEPAAQNQVMEFKSCAIHQSGNTFGASPFTESSNLRITNAATNPAYGSTITKPLILAVFSKTFLAQLAGTVKSYVLFAIPYFSKNNGDTIYMVGYLADFTWAGQETSTIYYYFHVDFIKNGYDPDTADPLDFVYRSSFAQRQCQASFSTHETLFVFSWMEALNTSGQYIRGDMEPSGWTLDKHILCFGLPCIHNFSDSSTLPKAGDNYPYTINSSNGAVQAAKPTGVNQQVSATLSFVSPAYVEYEQQVKIDYKRGYTSEQVGETSEAGGYENGTFEYEHDQISVTPKPVLGMSTSGMYHVYRVFNYQLADIGAEIIPKPIITPPAPNTGTDVTTAIKDGIDKLIGVLTLSLDDLITAMLEQKLIDYVVDLHLIPCQPPHEALDNVKVGWKTLEAQAYPISTDYVDISCGRIQTGEFYASFADYLTRVKLFLPFIGFVPVQPEWFQNATIGVDYRINVIDGSFMCYVTGYGQHINKGFDYGYHSGLLAQYSGNACIHMPITGTNYSTMLSGAIGAGLSLAASAGTGNLLGVAGSAISAMNAAPEVVQSNSYSASAAILSHRKPFLMIARPTSHYSELYQHELGLPANITARLGDLQGFVQMRNVHLDGIRGTDREKQIIEEKLAKGVIV